MSGCDAPIVVEVKCADSFTARREFACDCDHGEDDPCCTETETPESDRPRDDL